VLLDAGETVEVNTAGDGDDGDVVVPEACESDGAFDGALDVAGVGNGPLIDVVPELAPVATVDTVAKDVALDDGTGAVITPVVSDADVVDVSVGTVVVVVLVDASVDAAEEVVLVVGVEVAVIGVVGAGAHPCEHEHFAEAVAQFDFAQTNTLFDDNNKRVATPYKTV